LRSAPVGFPSTRVFWLAGFGLIAVLAGLVAHLAYPAVEAPPLPMIWQRGEVGDPASLDPHKATTQIEFNVLQELFEGLVAFDARGEIIPGAAESWTLDESGTVYRFKLRPDVRWSNGNRLTPEDFVFSFRRLMNPANGFPYANILYILKNAEKVNKGQLPIEALGVRAIDRDTLEIELDHPAAYFIDQLPHFTAWPVHRISVEAFGSDFVHPEHMVTNGPFRLKEFTPNDRIVLVRNPFFHDAAHVALDGEIFHSIEDRAAALRRFMAGEIHSYDDVPVEQIDFVRSHLADSFKVFENLASYFYSFDTRHKPFDDKRVRQALSMAVDREFLADRIWRGTMEPAYSFVPPGIASYGVPETMRWKGLDPFAREDEARRLLAEAGYGPGGEKLSVEIRFNMSENHRATAVAIADMWKALGVETRLLSTDATSHYAYLQSKQPFDVARSGWFADFPDAQNFLFLAQSDNQTLNYSSFKNDHFDALMRTAGEERSPDKRRTFLHEAEAFLLDEQPDLVLLTFKSRNLVSPKLQGWEENIRDDHPGRFISISP